MNIKHNYKWLEENGARLYREQNPGHLATAIAIGEDVNGDYICINGTKFLVCAPIGVTMPDMDNKAAKVIVLR